MNEPVKSRDSLLDNIYNLALEGIPIKSIPIISKSVKEIGDEYKIKYPSVDVAIDKLVAKQILLCGMSGFVTGIGGLISIPLTMPANIASVIYIQLRMIACIAYMKGFHLEDKEVQTLAYMCLAGSPVSDIIKTGGIEFVKKLTTESVMKIPRDVLTKTVNKKYISKLYEKGLFNLETYVPIVGGFVSGGIDIATTAIIASYAKRLFSYDFCFHKYCG